MKEPNVYYENSEHQIPNKYLDDETFVKAKAGFITVCTDCLIINREKRILYLGKRIVECAKGIWMTGGRRRAGEGRTESLQRLLKREIGLELSAERFQFLDINEYLWAKWKEKPTEMGAHDVCFIYTIELAPEEIAKATTHLDKEEYDTDFGLREFSRKDIENLDEQDNRKILLDLYDKIFP